MAQDFTAVDNTLLCVRSEFVETHPEASSERHCAFLCDSNSRCQAFSLIDGPCQLFVFDKCSKYVRDCSCSRRGRLFMKKKKAGLMPGVGLCPSGFANDFCGTKYKLFDVVNCNFDQTKSSIESQPGLVVMADVADGLELQHVFSLISAEKLELFLLGGYQLPGSSEPAGGWIWASCHETINSTLWQVGEPNNHGAGENVVSLYYNNAKINDNSASNTYTGALAECVSPFD